MTKNKSQATLKVEDCADTENAVFRAYFHLPKTPWHDHMDWDTVVEEDTTYQAFAQLTMSTLMKLSGGSNRLLIGFLADMLNVLPLNLRLAMMHVLANGLGLDIKTATDDLNTIDVNLVQRYEPLNPPEEKVSPLMTPGQVKVPPELLEKIRREGRL